MARIQRKTFDLSTAESGRPEILKGGARYLRAHQVPGSFELSLDGPAGPWLTITQPGNICEHLDEPLEVVHVRWGASAGTVELIYSASVTLDFEGGEAADDAGDLLARILPALTAGGSAGEITDLVSGRQNRGGSQALLNVHDDGSGPVTGWHSEVRSLAVSMEATGVTEEGFEFQHRGGMPVSVLNPLADAEADARGYYEIEQTIAVEWPTKIDNFSVYFGVGNARISGGTYQRHGIIWGISGSGGASINMSAAIYDNIGGGGVIHAFTPGAQRSTGAGDPMELVPWRLGLRIGVRSSGEPFVQALFNGNVAGERRGELSTPLDWSATHPPLVTFGTYILNSANVARGYFLLDEGLTIRHVRTDPPVTV